MKMREKNGYSLKKFMQEHEKDIFPCTVEGIVLREDVGRKYITLIRVRAENELGRPVFEGLTPGRYFIHCDYIPELEIMVGDGLVCAGKLDGKRYQADLIANRNTGVVYETNPDRPK